MHVFSLSSETLNWFSMVEDWLKMNADCVDEAKKNPAQFVTNKKR